MACVILSTQSENSNAEMVMLDFSTTYCDKMFSPNDLKELCDVVQRINREQEFFPWDDISIADLFDVGVLCLNQLLIFTTLDKVDDVSDVVLLDKQIQEDGSTIVIPNEANENDYLNIANNALVFKKCQDLLRAYLNSRPERKAQFAEYQFAQFRSIYN